MIKVLIADDQKILRESLKLIIEQDDEIIVTGCCANGNEAVACCKENVPDVVLMDIVMPECDGVEGTKLIKSMYPEVRIIILTTYNDHENITKALSNGADGFLLKEIEPTDLIIAIKSTYKGFSIIHPNTFHNVVRYIPFDNQMTEKDVKAPNFKLTNRERSVVKLIMDGKGNKEIAASLFITEGTVKNVVSTILEKMELKDRTQLAIFAVKNNLLGITEK